MKKRPTVNLITNRPKRTLYIGVTSNLSKRVWEHKNKVVSGFSGTYNLTKLVYFELCEGDSGHYTREAAQSGIEKYKDRTD